MDFIKTSSLRALNWSRRLYRALRPNAHTGRSRNERTAIVPRTTSAPSRQVHGRAHVPTRKQRPAVEPFSLATTSRARPRARTGKQFAAARHTSRTRGRSIRRPGRLRPVTRIIGQSSIRPTRRPNAKTLGHDRSDRADSRPRPDSRPIDPNARRPEARFEARFTRFHGPA
ncbi:unnamed protein product [Microthlaspi erraticum]|uniref:Uncharacterized protein n=1 Tax=Microthlaspi erraticum TaxID=1685480 RepID=A0A6D2I5V9_9BRAS|nr:unnamed protein product [Microthlaspi erraticum]